MTLELAVGAASAVLVFANFLRTAREGPGGLRPFLHPRALIAWAVAAGGFTLAMWAAKVVDLGQAGETSRVSLSLARTLLLCGMGSFAISLSTALGYGLVLRRRYDALWKRLTHLIHADTPVSPLTGDSAKELSRLQELVPYMWKKGRDRDRLLERIAELRAVSPGQLEPRDR